MVNLSSSFNHATQTQQLQNANHLSFKSLQCNNKK